MLGNILAVEDDPRIRVLLERLLGEAGYSVLTVGSGHEAMQVLEHVAPDLILLDITLPRMDGFEVCRRIRSTHAHRLTPIIMVTAMCDTNSVVRALENGADEFLPKPFAVSELLARAGAMLRIKRLTDQLESTEQVVFMLARTVAARDDCTDGHLRRLTEYSHALALAIGCDADEARNIRYGGMLHDIGKIGIDETVLKKPGPLTPAERDEMRRHPAIGAGIIAPMRFSRTVGPIVAAHHEWWDGRGYPNGLAGEDIPLGARIVAVVDGFDAMSTDRPYRRALPRDEVVRQLREGRGTQWQPKLVDVFLELVASGALERIDTGPSDVESRASVLSVA